MFRAHAYVLQQGAMKNNLPIVTSVLVVLLPGPNLMAKPDAAVANPAAILEDSHRSLRAPWGASITTREQLANITNDLSGSYVLEADIDLSDAPWKPIGKSSSPFTGQLYGQGHAITGLSFSDTSSGDSHGTLAGLFRCVKNATLDGIVLENVEVGGFQYVGALAGEVQGETSISDCYVSGVVRSASSFAGMLVGRVYNSPLTTFDGCEVEGVVISSAANTGGLVGGIVSSSADFFDCKADVDVSGTGGDNKGGFAGLIQNDSGSVLFDGCSAFGDVTAGSSGYVGGFIGYAARPVFCANCHARGGATGYRYAGGFVGGAGGSGSTFDECSANGDVIAANGSRAGGFVGHVTTSNDFWRCMSSGSAKGSQYIGGFAGQLAGGGTIVSECFALGNVTAAQTGDSYAGGFAGDVSVTASLSDSYCLGTVKGQQMVGGFTGRNYSPDTMFTRCYAAGAVDCSGTFAGAFAGKNQSAPTFTDCAVLAGDLHAIGAGTAGSSTENADVAEFSATGMKSAGNFQTWLAIDDDDGAVWTQTDGVTQPYLAWSADANGRLKVYASVGGTARGRIEGAGTWYEPGDVVTVAASSDEGFFVRWAGSTPYVNPLSSNTTFRLDNHRIAAAEFGLYITDADGLDAIRNDLSGVYGLANDIDLAGRQWNPIGNNSAKFTGSLYGFGHKIENMVATNAPTSNYRGVFGYASGATLDGIAISGMVKGRQYIGGLAGYIENGTSVRGCSAVVDVVASSSYAGGLVGNAVGSNEFWRCMSAGAVRGSQYVGGLVGQFNGAGTIVTECFAIGNVTATQSGDAYAGGFVGTIPAAASVSDSYGLGVVKGQQKVGGFAGCLNHASITLRRCYAAGEVDCAGSYAGSLVGYPQNASATFDDCAALGDAGNGIVHAVGTSTAGTSSENANIAEFSVAELKSAANFDTWLLVDDLDGSVWLQVDGVTQPYLAWSAPDGDLALYAAAAGSAPGSVSGAGRYAPGSSVTVAATTAEGFFAQWAGTASYADPSSATTSFPLDNHRVVTALFGKYVTDADELDSIRNDLGGIYGLANDIDLAGREWTPIGTSDSVRFSGTFLGFGHTISNLTVDRGSSDYAGLFGCIGGGTVTDVRLVTPVVRGRKYTATLTGRMINASTVSGCSAVGATVEASGERVGGLVGDMSAASLLSRSFFLGDVTATSQYVGGLVGIVNQPGSTVSECFACGSATSASGRIGGLVGWVGGGSAFSDCYALESVRGTERVGGFVGYIETAATSVTRCYAAGGDTVGNSDFGGFAGYQSGLPSITNCFRLADGLEDIGAKDHAGITALDRVGMLAIANFDVFHATGKWSQIDGMTQPYFDWSLEDGKMTLIAKSVGSVTGTVEVSGLYAPGANVTIAAASTEGFFARWTGAAPYADPSSATTTILLDNHRVATASFGKYITNADELDAVRNDLSGIYGLANDIDLSGRQWTPIGNGSTKFTGALYGFGHRIDNMVATSNSGNQYRGLFGYTMGATLDGITVTGKVKATADDTGGLVGRAAATMIANCTSVVEIVTTRQYAGGLVGRLESGTSIVGCLAAGTLSAANGTSGGLVGGLNGGLCEIRDSVSSVEVVSTSSSVGGFIGYAYNSDSGESVISGCRADGYAGGNGDVGGFIGYAAAPITISNCVARGDVRSSNSNYGGFIGRLDKNTATIDDCWCSGAVWGTGGMIGSFVGNMRNGTIRNCSVYAYGAGPRPFCGNDGNFAGGALAAGDFVTLTNGWPAVKQHIDGALEIKTAEDLANVSANLAGIYVLANDIDLGGATITPIGNDSAGFSGEFYGQNHKIENFTINSDERFVGLFGRIAGGRVNNVSAQGSVSGAYMGSSDPGVGGFAGKIESCSLVDGCSFQGSVSNSCNYGGGFVGYVDSSPVILRSSFVGTVTKSTSGGNEGGFVGCIGDDGAGIMDCYAVADVSAGSNAYVGGFVGLMANGARITLSWCSGNVKWAKVNRGAFAGGASAGDITKSYYDSGKTTLKAVNGADYAGITSVSSANMRHAASFPDFDFTATWEINEGETTPYLRIFILQKTEYEVWLEQWGLPNGSDPLMVVNGIPLAARYLFGIVPLSHVTDVDGNPVMDIKFDASGNPYLKFPSLKRANDIGAVFTVIATPDLNDWAIAPGKTWPREYNVDLSQGLCLPVLGTPIPPKMFFRYKVAIE